MKIQTFILLSLFLIININFNNIYCFSRNNNNRYIKKLSDSELINNLIQLNQNAKNNSVSINQIVSNLKDTFNDNIQDEKTVQFISECNSGVQGIDDFLTSLKARNATLLSKINQIENENSNLKIDIEEKYNQYTESKNALQENSKKLIELTQNYKNVATEIDEKLEILKLLINLINDSLLSKSGNNELSFLEITNQFKENSKNLLSLLKKKNQMVDNPTLGILLSLETEKLFANKEMIRKLLNSLENMDENLRKFKLNLHLEKEKDLELIKTETTKILQEIKDLSHIITDEYASRLKVDAIINSYKNDLVLIEMQYKRKSKERNFWTKFCNNEKMKFKLEEILEKQNSDAFKNITLNLENIK